MNLIVQKLVNKPNYAEKLFMLITKIDLSIQ
ncbi:hypothetical protein N483_23690 [Pseudoalteromonas luteoviolacea NCIMB 1944]|nr:hypothetical protein N483_23690 [Pseudoalteromonas luteoviolacea NCIMB 1944]